MAPGRSARASFLLPVVLTSALALVLAGSGPARAATTIDLGTAGSFAVLAGSGITNSGETTIVGDIGSSPTPAETGVGPCPAANCVVLTGSDHPDDATAQQAKQDLTTAYDAAAGQPADASVSADLGGQTFTPGVYNAASSLGLTGEVTLDAQNVGGAVFIFQAGSTLTTASASSVRLINGASACNVFFQVGSAATLGGASTFRGTILAHDSISLDDAVTVEGRLLGGEQSSGTGAATLIHDTITTPSCTSGGTSGGTTGTSGTSGGTTGTSGGTTGGTSGTSGGTSGGTTGTGGTTGGGTAGPAGATTGGTAGTATGGTTSTGTGGSSAPTVSSSSTPQGALPFSGSPTGATALAGVLAMLLGGLALLVARRPRTQATQLPSVTW